MSSSGDFMEEQVIRTTSNKWIAIAYATCIAAQVAFAMYAFIAYTWYRRTKNKDVSGASEFVTARGTASQWRVMAAFFASAVGAWCLVTPSQFAVFTGIIGLLMYAIASGMPILVIALFGSKIQAMHPDVVSVSDFVGKRFGPLLRTVVVLLALFNMAIAMLAEYITIGSLFEFFVNTKNWPIMLSVGVLTMMYTSYGGTYVSILTDQLQAILTATLITVLFIYTAATFRAPVDRSLSAVGGPLGPNKYGYSAIFSMPCSLMASTVFNDAMWQKVWAGADRRAVVMGGVGGSILVMLAVFVLGFGGWLAAWAGFINENTNINLYLFQVFKEERGADGQTAYLRSWVGVIALLLAATMNESAIDSLQSGLSGALTGQFFRNQHAAFPRAIVYIINIPLIVIAAKLGPQIPVLGLFLIANMVTTCCFMPVLSGVWRVTGKYVTETAAIVGCCVSIFTLCAYGAGRHMATMKYTCMYEHCGFTYETVYLRDKAHAIRFGVWYAWYGNTNYDWDYFLVASGFSVVGMFLWIIPAALLRRFFGITGPGISGAVRSLFVAMRCPRAFDILTGTEFQTDLVSALTGGRIVHAGHDTPPPSLEFKPQHPSMVEVDMLAAKAQQYVADDSPEKAQGKPQEPAP